MTVDRRSFIQWFSGAVAAAGGGAAVAGKGDGIAAYMFPENAPGLVPGAFRPVGRLGLSQVLSARLEEFAGGDYIGSRHGGQRLKIDCLLEPEHLKLALSMEPVALDMAAIFPNCGIENIFPEDTRWVLVERMINMEPNGLPRCTLEFARTQPVRNGWYYEGDE